MPETRQRIRDVFVSKLLIAWGFIQEIQNNFLRSGLKSFLLQMTTRDANDRLSFVDEELNRFW